jgi:DNA-binding response OmpR family regulator
MVVDDDRELREIVTEYLVEEGFEVHSVPNGLKLMRALRVDRPDVIILDVMMSWINGFDLCSALKHNPEFCDIPVMFMSARSDPADVERGYQCGAVDYVVKPFDVTDLRARIERALTFRPREIAG